MPFKGRRVACLSLLFFRDGSLARGADLGADLDNTVDGTVDYQYAYVDDTW